MNKRQKGFADKKPTQSKFGQFAKEQQQRKEKNGLKKKQAPKKEHKGFKAKNVNLDTSHAKSAGVNNKKLKFQLDSDNEDSELQLKHKGQLVDQIDDFQEPIDRSDSDGNGSVDADFVKNVHFFDGNNKEKQALGKRKSKQEIYDEIILKSKKMKHEKQRQAEDDKEKLEEINKDFSGLVKLLNFRKQDAREADRIKYEGEEDLEYYDLAAKIQNEDKQRANQNIKKVESKKQKIQKEKQRNLIKSLLSSDDDQDAIVNDDELELKTKKEKGMVKHYRKVEKLNKFVDLIQSLKAENKIGSDDDSLDYVGSEEDEDDGQVSIHTDSENDEEGDYVEDEDAGEENEGDDEADDENQLNLTQGGQIYDENQEDNDESNEIAQEDELESDVEKLLEQDEQ